MKANLDSTLKELGAHFGENANSGGADLSNLQKLLESSEHVPLELYLAQLRSDVSSKPAANTKAADVKAVDGEQRRRDRFNRIASR